MDKRDGEEASLGRIWLESSLHPILVLGLLIEDKDDVSLFKGELVFIVSLAVVESATAAESGEIVPL